MGGIYARIQPDTEDTKLWFLNILIPKKYQRAKVIKENNDCCAIKKYTSFNNTDVYFQADRHRKTEIVPDFWDKV